MIGIEGVKTTTHGGWAVGGRVMGRRQILIKIIIILPWIFGTVIFDCARLCAHLPHDPIKLVLLSPNYGADKTIFIASFPLTKSNSMALKSEDGGFTWDVMPVPTTPISTMDISPQYASDRTLFIGTSGRGVLRSQDRGNTWQACGDETGADVSCLAVFSDFEELNRVYAVNINNQFYESNDRGDNWELLSDLRGCCTETKILTMCVVPGVQNINTVFLGSKGDGIFKSTDGGYSWIPLNSGLSSLIVTSLVSPVTRGAENREIFAGTLGGGIFVSIDGGISWSSRSEGITDPDIISLCLHPCYPERSILFATTRSGGVFKSQNGGMTWSPAGSIYRELTEQTNVHFISIAMSPEYDTDETVFLATYEGFWISLDGGDTWEYEYILPNRIVRSIAFSPNYENDKTVAVTTYGSGVLQSLDAGESWQPRVTGLADAYSAAVGFSPNYAADNTIVAVGHFGLEKSLNGGASWDFFCKILGEKMYARTFVFAPNYEMNSVILVGTNTNSGGVDYFWYKERTLSKSGVWLSTDGGSNWIPTEMNAGRVHSLSISPNWREDGTVFAALGEDLGFKMGIYKSTDRGIHWAQMDIGSLDPHVSLVLVSPHYRNDQTVFAGTMYGGVISSVDGGETWNGCSGTEDWAITDIVISPYFSEDESLFVATHCNGVQKSEDGGRSWTPTGLETLGLTALGISPSFSTDETIFAAAYKGVFRSMDGGNSWEEMYPVFRYEDDNPCIVYAGGWEGRNVGAASTLHVYKTINPGATAELSFNAPSVTWVSARGPSHGMAAVYVDGMLSALVDLYNPYPRFQEVVYQSETLTNDKHRIAIVVLEERNPLSKGNLVTVDAFDIQIGPE